MELMEGFKKTEVGMIPKDWDCLQLKDVCRLICDGTHYTPTYVQHGVPFYSVENVTANDFINTKFISESEHSKLVKRCRPERGDIVMTRITAGVLGDTKLLDWDVNASIYVSLALLKLNANVFPEYLYRYTKSSAFIKDVEKRGLVNATPKKINMNEIGAIPIPAPRSKKEQRNIATALSDVEALITAQDKLIAKKRAIKTAAIQQLLTGTKRLMGFSGEWVQRSFGNIFDYYPTATNSRTDLAEDSGDTYYIHYGDIHTKYHSHLDFRLQRPPMIMRRLCKNAATLRNGDWVMADASEDFEGVGKSIEISGLRDGVQAVAGLHTFLLREKTPTYSPGFKGHLGELKSLSQQLLRVATGLKVFGVSKTALKDLLLPVPSPEEQAAIVVILSEMDAEIKILELRRDKTKAIKQGMMQELLTGRTRLI